MTVLVIDQKNKIVASDSAATDGWSANKVQKVFELDDGSLVVFCGKLVSATKFVRWLREGANKKEKPFEKADAHNEGDSFTGFVINDKGVFCYESGVDEYQVFDDFIISGSGGDAAKAAIEMGADIQKSIEVACKVCHLTCGLPVQMKVYKKKKKPRKTKNVANGV